ncbi:unnamed protein product [Spodoptera exigua]|nr:unnamed protein product [Spodoptera exigua]
MFCKKPKAPLELGEWEYHLKHMDSAVVENPPLSINEGQMYVYENYFPNYTIKYIYVDNLAMRSCGASAAIKTGGIDSSYVVLVLHAHINQEIRSVIDIWGERTTVGKSTITEIQPDETTSISYLMKRGDTKVKHLLLMHKEASSKRILAKVPSFSNFDF